MILVSPRAVLQPTPVTINRVCIPNILPGFTIWPTKASFSTGVPGSSSASLAPSQALDETPDGEELTDAEMAELEQEVKNEMDKLVADSYQSNSTAAGQHPGVQGQHPSVGQPAGLPQQAGGQHPGVQGQHPAVGQPAEQAGGQHPGVQGQHPAVGQPAGLPQQAGGQHPGVQGQHPAVGQPAGLPQQAGGQHLGVQGQHPALGQPAGLPQQAGGQHPGVQGQHPAAVQHPGLPQPGGPPGNQQAQLAVPVPSQQPVVPQEAGATVGQPAGLLQAGAQQAQVPVPSQPVVPQAVATVGQHDGLLQGGGQPGAQQAQVPVPSQPVVPQDASATVCQPAGLLQAGGQPGVQQAQVPLPSQPVVPQAVATVGQHDGLLQAGGQPGVQQAQVPLPSQPAVPREAAAVASPTMPTIVPTPHTTFFGPDGLPVIHQVAQQHPAPVVQQAGATVGQHAGLPQAGGQPLQPAVPQEAGATLGQHAGLPQEAGQQAVPTGGAVRPPAALQEMVVQAADNAAHVAAEERKRALQASNLASSSTHRAEYMAFLRAAKHPCLCLNFCALIEHPLTSQHVVDTI